MDLELKSKRALITGSYRGTGLGIARALAKEGAQVLIHGFEENQAKDAVVLLAGEGLTARPVWGDILTPKGSDMLAAQVRDSCEGRGPEILINNYGTAERGKWGDLDIDDWIDSYQKNVLSATRLINAFLDDFKASGWGRIVQIGTIGSYSPNKVMPHYYAAKGAMANMSISLSLALAGSGVTVNTISPGLIKTAEVEAAFRAKAKKDGWGDDWAEIEKKIAETSMPNPMQRIARTEEVGDLVAFICSARADFLNGLNIRVDGGAAGLTI
jgi:3-oxoacyl-[acyl-carrier protein] reductase